MKKNKKIFFLLKYYLYLYRVNDFQTFKHTQMKKARTKKDLLNHPLVDSVEKEYNPSAFDGYEYTYWLYLKGGYWFKEMQQGLLHEPTIRRLCDEFNSMTITERTDGF